LLCPAASGNAANIVPYAEDQELTMKVNAHLLSGMPEEYVAVRSSIPTLPPHSHSVCGEDLASISIQRHVLRAARSAQR